jgi:c-di-GMP-binding flagellar brake protein YcgR
MVDPSVSERRKHKRIPFIHEVEVIGVGTRRCSDLSIGGMYLETVSVFPVGETLRLRFTLQDGDVAPFESSARVLYAHESVGVGLFFLNLTDDQQVRLQRFIDQR